MRLLITMGMYFYLADNCLTDVFASFSLHTCDQILLSEECSYSPHQQPLFMFSAKLNSKSLLVNVDYRLTELLPPCG